jgi:hypothetical protein
MKQVDTQTDLGFYTIFFANLNGNCVGVLGGPVAEQKVSSFLRDKRAEMPVDDGYGSSCFRDRSAEFVSNTTIAYEKVSVDSYQYIPGGTHRP